MTPDLREWFSRLPGPRRYLLVGVVAVAAHAAALGGGFVQDDHPAVVGNPAVHGALDPATLLGRDFWGQPPGSPGAVGTYRPLPALTFWLDWHLGGGAPWVFHLTNLLLHALAAMALTAALGASESSEERGGRGAPSPVAVLAGVVFAALAVNSEAVAGVVGRADVMAAGLGFVAWALARSRPLGAAGALLAALLCKESAIVWLAAVPLCDRPRRAHLWLLAAPAAYLALRGATYGFAAADLAQFRNNNPLIGEPLATRALTSLGLLALSVGRTLWPMKLSADYSFAQILPARGVDVDVAAGAVVLAGLLAAATLLRRRAALAARGAALFLLAWAAVANVAITLPTIFAERLLYLPAAGAAALLAAALSALARRARRAAWALTVILVGGNLVRAAARDLDWRDDLSLFGAAVEAAPRSARAWANYGAALTRAGRRPEALAAFEQAMEIAPLWAAPRTLAGVELDRAGESARAEPLLRRAVELEPDLDEAQCNLAFFLARHGRAPEAMDRLRDHVARHPESTRAREILALIEARRRER
jgi:Flp pilus assembly protein TadD